MDLYFEDWFYGKDGNFPATSGIYCVFSEMDGNLIYIGESKNIRKRIHEHERWLDFESYRTGDYLAVTYARILPSWRHLVEGRLIRSNRPPENPQIPTEYYRGPLRLTGFVWGISP